MNHNTKRNYAIAISLIFIFSSIVALRLNISTTNNNYQQRMITRQYNEIVDLYVDVLKIEMDSYNYSKFEVYIRSSFENINEMNEILLEINPLYDFKEQVKSHIEIGKYKILDGELTFEKFADCDIENSYIIYPSIKKNGIYTDKSSRKI